MGHKFYICQFDNKKYPTPSGWVFVKFGITHHMDVLKRFDSSIDDGYSKNYSDWNISCKFSILCKSKDHALEMEEFFLQKKYPYKSKYKVWVEKYLGMEDHNQYDNNTGISELRLLPIREAKQLYKRCNQRKKEIQNGAG